MVKRDMWSTVDLIFFTLFLDTELHNDTLPMCSHGHFSSACTLFSLSSVKKQEQIYSSSNFNILKITHQTGDFGFGLYSTKYNKYALAK